MRLLHLRLRFSSFEDQPSSIRDGVFVPSQAIAVKGRATLRGAVFPKKKLQASLFIKERVGRLLGIFDTTDTQTIFAP